MREVFSPSLDMSHLNLGLNELLHSFPEGGNSGTRGFEEGQRKPEDAPLHRVVLGPALPSVLPMPSPLSQSRWASPDACGRPSTSCNLSARGFSHFSPDFSTVELTALKGGASGFLLRMVLPRDHSGIVYPVPPPWPTGRSVHSPDGETHQGELHRHPHCQRGGVFFSH